ncbi:alcohol dehydrogenase [Venturia nashicola]|nr:alcohol dehydrogenase [Venturia nashicola]
MSSHAALVVAAIGSPMIASTRTTPTPGPNQILVRVHIAGLNPHDAKAQSTGLFINQTLPSPLAIDIVGQVIILGSAVTKYKIGDVIFSLVAPMDPDAAGTQEYALLEEELSALVPRGVGEHEAAVLALNPVTAFWGMFREGGLGIPPPLPFLGHDPSFEYGKQSIAVIGGGSAVGKYVVALAKYAGFGTIIVTASKARNEQQLMEWGATHVLDRSLPVEELQARVKEIVGDDLIYVYDAVNPGQAAELGASFLSTSKPGRLVVITGGDFDASKVEGKKAGFVRKMVYAAVRDEPELGKSYWDNVGKLIENGDLKPTAYEEIVGLDAEKVNEVLKGYTEGKAVVKPQLKLI